MPNPTDAQKEILSAENKLYDAKNGIMATAELSHYFSSWKASQKLVLQYADKGLAQNMISQGGMVRRVEL